MELTIVGSGTGVPNLRRCSPCVVMRARDRLAAFDLGPGALRKMLEADLSHADLDAVHFTHTHVDHVNDLAQLLFASRYDEQPRRSPLVITGPPGFREFCGRLAAAYGDQIAALDYKLAIEELSRDERRYGSCVLRSWPTAHMLPSTGYRVEADGGAFAYAGDTGYCPEVVELARGVDVLVIEAALPPGRELAGHLQPHEAGRIAAEAQAGTLVITHLYPICDRYEIETEVQKTFSGRTLVAEDLLRLNL